MTAAHAACLGRLPEAGTDMFGGPALHNEFAFQFVGAARPTP
jgi:hypothetical protein